MTESPAISLIVPCRNEAGHIEDCLRSLLGQQRPLGGLEIIVADGMSDDGTRSILERLAPAHPELRLIDNPGRIVSTALNAGVAAARGRVIIRMDAHTQYASDYVCQCLAVLDETGAEAVGGPWIARGSRFVERAIAAVFQSPFCAGGARAHDPSYAGPIDTVYLGCWRRELFERVGPFDEELVRNQDDEFSLRIIRSGGAIWQSPRIKSWYTPRGSLGALLRQYAQYGYWKVRVIQKHRLPASPRHLVPSAFVLSLVALLAGSAWSELAGWGAIGLAAAYALGTVMASVHAAARSEWKLLPLMPLVFACYHIGYGWGFLHGVWDLVILRRRPRPHYSALTRASARR
jgi:glycosyltransferase involved in cell wall biosynthesis